MVPFEASRIHDDIPVPEFKRRHTRRTTIAAFPSLWHPFSRGWSGCWCSAWIKCQGRTDSGTQVRPDIIIRKFRLFLVRWGISGLQRDPRKSARWFQCTFGLRKTRLLRNGVAVGNDNITIAAVSKGNHRPRHLTTCLSICRIWQH